MHARRHSFAVRGPLPLAVAVVAVSLVATAPPTSAQSSSPDRPRTVRIMSLGDFLVAVDDSNPKVAAARALAAATALRVPGSTLPPDPQVQLGFMNYRIPQLGPMDALGMTQLQVMQMIPTGAKLRHSGRLFAERAAAQRERADDVLWDTRSRVAMAFYELYGAQQSLGVAVETRRVLMDIARLAGTMYEVGEGRQADILRARVEVDRMTEDIARMEAMGIASSAKLNALLDRPDSVLGLVALPVFPVTVPSLDSLVALAISSRPMLRAGVHDVQAADAAVKLAQSEIWPDIVLGLQYAQRGGEMGTERMGSLMLGASIPVFADRRQRLMRQEAGAMRAMVEADLRFMRAETRGRVVELHASLLRARRLSQLYATSVLPQAEAAAASALAAYRVGRVDFMTLLDDRMTVNAYRQQLIALQAEEGRVWADLEMLIGRSLVDANSVSPIDGGRP
jgi:outer membrane protein, heavy metal efflux system